MLPVFTAKAQSNDMKLSREKKPQAKGQEKLPNTPAMGQFVKVRHRNPTQDWARL